MLGFPGKSIAVTLLLALSFGAPRLHAGTAPAAKPRPTAAQVLRHTVAMHGLLPVHVDRQGGRILVTLPAPQADGVSARF
ncbi:MAG: hypothetical protein KGJ97_09280, partial [Xanthomonadaceae bacterium]|nr:hypothetical protein [Xanthomonadaceae bacterium]